MDDGASPVSRSSPRFFVGLVSIAVAALIFRISYVLALRHHFPAPDGLYYHGAAVLMRGGHLFVNPFNGAPAAFHPPAWTVVLTIPPLLGENSQLSAQLLAACIGVATVIAIGFAGRRVSS